MNPDVLLVVGCLLISSGLTYAWWSWARIWILRQDVFDIRDQLWDKMRAKGTLDSDEHIKARDRINHMIRFAPMLSLPAILAAILIERQEQPSELFDPKDEDIRAAYFAVGSAAMTYIMRETLAGRTISLFMRWVIRGDKIGATIGSTVRDLIDRFLHNTPITGC